MPCTCPHGSSKVGFRAVQLHVNGLKEVRVGATNRLTQRSSPESEVALPLKQLRNQMTFPVADEQVNGLREDLICSSDIRKYFLELLRGDWVADSSAAFQSVAKQFVFCNCSLRSPKSQAQDLPLRSHSLVHPSNP